MTLPKTKGSVLLKFGAGKKKNLFSAVECGSGAFCILCFCKEKLNGIHTTHTPMLRIRGVKRETPAGRFLFRRKLDGGQNERTIADVIGDPLVVGTSQMPPKFFLLF